MDYSYFSDVNYLKLLNHFRVLASHLNYTAAAKELDISYSALTKSIIILEKKTKIKLFKKSKWKMLLTTEGKIFLDHIMSVFYELEKANLFLTGNKKEEPIFTELTIVTTQGLAGDYIYKLLFLLKDNFKNLSLNLLSYTEELALDQEKFDIYIGPRIANFSNFNEKKIIDLGFRFFASKEYAQAYGLPKNLLDLENHKVVRYAQSSSLFYREVEEPYENHTSKACYSTNSYFAEFRMVQEGKAIGLLSTLLKKDKLPDAVDVFPDLPTKYISIYAQYKNSIQLGVIKYALKEISLIFDNELI